MAENQASGPQLGQSVLHCPTPGTGVPAIITDIAPTTGLVRLTTFPPGGTTVDQQNVQYDGTGTVANSWRYPGSLTGI